MTQQDSNPNSAEPKTPEEREIDKLSKQIDSLTEENEDLRKFNKSLTDDYELNDYLKVKEEIKRLKEFVKSVEFLTIHDHDRDVPACQGCMIRRKLKELEK